MRSREKLRILSAFCLIGVISSSPCVYGGSSERPPEPIDITPINGEAYYIQNQLSGLQADLNGNSTAAGAEIVQQPRSFTNLSQRWVLTSVSGSWQISNLRNGLCLDGAGAHQGVVQNPCGGAATQRWVLSATSNGYYTIGNQSSGLVMDLSKGSAAAGTALGLTALSVAAAQSQQWLLRPAFFRGVDNALLEKQEAARAAMGLAWWNDAGQAQDVLQILKNHGVNLVRLRPSSMPPYADVSETKCSGNACYGETDAQDLDLAKRAKNLGMSIEVTLLFDGGSSASVPPAWIKDTELSELQADLYSYVKAETLSYRKAGVMPDLVAIGNEVDTGFLGAIGSPTGESFGGFAALETAAAQAVEDAAADTSIGPAIPAPLTCIHITPGWDLSQFFSLANHFGIPYDAICQSYYPIYHGPLTAQQAGASNPGNKPVEQEVLTSAAHNIGKPIFIIETGEHYENGFAANDPWYAPPSETLQRQFLLDLEGVEKGLPDNLGMGIAYWDAAGVNIPRAGGGFINGDSLANAIYLWNGLTLFDNADAAGTTNVEASNYSTLLAAMDALGGKLDPSLSYKFVNGANGHILSVYQGSHAAGAMLNTAPDNGVPALSQQWRITSDNDGYFQIASLNPGANNATYVLADSRGSAASGNAVIQSPSGTSKELEWNIVSAGNGYFRLGNRISGLVLDMAGGVGAQAGFAVQEPENDGSATQQWQIVPVNPRL